MPRIQLELNEETIVRAQRAAEDAHCSVEELFARLLEHVAIPAPGPDPLLGLMADEPGLIDQVLESAMKARAERILRHTGG